MGQISNSTNQSCPQSTSRRPSHPFGAHLLWSLWFRHFWQLLHQNLTSNAIGDCALNYRKDVKLGSNGLRQASIGLVLHKQQLVAGPRAFTRYSTPCISFWNGAMSPINLKHSKKKIWALSLYLYPSLRHVYLEIFLLLLKVFTFSLHCSVVLSP